MSVCNGARNPCTKIHGVWADGSPTPTALIFGNSNMGDKALKTSNDRFMPEVFVVNTGRVSHMQSGELFLLLLDTWVRECIRQHRHSAQLSHVFIFNFYFAGGSRILATQHQCQLTMC
jgi:hypothetical protein